MKTSSEVPEITVSDTTNTSKVTKEITFLKSNDKYTCSDIKVDDVDSTKKVPKSDCGTIGKSPKKCSFFNFTGKNNSRSVLTFNSYT